VPEPAAGWLLLSGLAVLASKRAFRHASRIGDGSSVRFPRPWKQGDSPHVPGELRQSS
jgi:hypothetical protein